MDTATTKRIKELSKEKTKLITQMAAISKKLSNVSEELHALTTDQKVTPVKEYNSMLPWKMKIIYAINKIGEGGVKEILEALLKVDDSLTTESYGTVQRNLLRLIVDKIVVKTGKYKSTYKLNL